MLETVLNILSHDVIKVPLIVGGTLLGTNLMTNSKLKKVKAGSFELDMSGGTAELPDKCPFPEALENEKKLLNALERVDKVEESVLQIAETVKQMSIEQQKQSFYDQNQSEQLRMVAGLRYVQLGGNGHTMADVRIFAYKHKDIYDALTLANHELRLHDG